MARRCPDYVAREDLVAGRHARPDRGRRPLRRHAHEPFLSFAEAPDPRPILDELRRGDMLPRRVRQLARKIGNAIRTLEATGQQPSEQLVADAIGVPVDTYRTGLAQLVNAGRRAPRGQRRALVADRALRTRRAGRAPPAARHRAPRARQLDTRDVTILGLHYLEDLTYQQIAETLRITPSRVCQLLWRAIERLRNTLGEQTLREAA